MPGHTWFVSLHPVAQALVAALFTWAVTAIGAAVVFFAKDVSRRMLDTALGFTAGVMIAASFWSLLAPSIVLAKDMGMIDPLAARRLRLPGRRRLPADCGPPAPARALVRKEAVVTAWQARSPVAP
jgi:hypothetical protein